MAPPKNVMVSPSCESCRPSTALSQKANESFTAEISVSFESLSLNFAVSGAVEQFLPVLDNFHLALRSSGSLEQLRSGLELVVKQMEEVLRSLPEIKK